MKATCENKSNKFSINVYSTYLDIQNNQSISFHIRGNTISFYSVAFEAEQHLIYTRVAKANKPMSQI